MSCSYTRAVKARTTVRLDERLLKDAKRYALERNKTLTAVIEEALRDKLGEKEAAETEPFVLPTHNGGLRPGIDLTNRGLVEDIMDGLVDPP